MAEEGDVLGTGDYGGGDDDIAVLRSLEKVLANQSAKQRHLSSNEHVDLLERGAALKTRVFGPQSSAARKALRDTIVACNSLAMSALGRGKTERCRELLARAFEIASDRQMRTRDISDARHEEDSAADIGRGGGGGDPVLQILTLNNTACLHRRLGEPKRALRCLRRAAELGRRSGGSEHLEVTHLNACAVLSELGRHEEAVEHARSAVYYGQELEEAGTRDRAAERGGETRLSSSSGGGKGSRRARLATLAISYYNLAVELEYTHRYEACLRWYNEAVKLARDPDVHNEELVKTFQRSYAGARKKHAPPYYQPSRLGGSTKASTAGEATLSRIHEEETPEEASPSPFRVLRPLDVGAPLSSDVAGAAGSPGTSSTAQELANGQRRRMLPDGGVADDLRVQEHHRQTDWPVFSRVERQRASDERRSHAWKHHNSSSNRNRDAGPHNVSQPSAALYPTGVCRSDPLLQQQLDSRHSRDDAQAVANGTHNGPSRTAVRARPASGSAAGRVFGSDPTIPPKPSRKRPASADIVRERDRRVSGRIRLDKVSEAPYESPAVAEPIRWQQQQQQQQQLTMERCRAVVQAPIEHPRRKSGPGMVAAAAEGVRQEGRRPHDHSRRPKSAYPRLEDGGSRHGDSLGVETGAEGRRSSASSSRIGRIRSLSARALKGSASAPAPSTSTLPNGWDRDCQSVRDEEEGEYLAVTREEEECRREREEEEGEEAGRTTRRDVADGSSPLWQGRGDVMMATTTTTRAGKMSSRPNSDKGNASKDNDTGASSGQNDHNVSSSMPDTENDLSRTRKPSVASQSPQSKPTKVPSGSFSPATQVVSAPPPSSSSSTPGAAAAAAAARARARKSTRKPVVARSPPSRSRKGGSPRGRRQRKANSATSKEQHRHGARDTRPDNGRDGKLYVDVDSDEKQLRKSTRLDSASYHNNVNPRFDNGRDGKLYVEADNGRDGKLYGELEDCEEQSNGELNGARYLEAAPGENDEVANKTNRNGRGLETDVIGTAEEPIRQEKAAEPLPLVQRAKAATAIQRAIAGAAIRRRSSGHGGGAKGTGKTVPEKNLLGPAGGGRRALSHRESDSTQQRGEKVSAAEVATATSEKVSASESVIQNRRQLAREAANRHVLAASTIRAWAARTCLARRLHRRKRVRDELKLRWEPEIQRIAATRIQAVARGVVGRQARWTAERAAVNIQRVQRGQRGRSAVNELARARLEERRCSCKTIQRVFRGHRGRQKALRTRQIAWEETVARQRAAGVLQSAWCHRPSRWILQEQQREPHHESATTIVVQEGGDDSASLAASSMTPTAGTEQTPSTEQPHAIPRQQLLRAAEAHGAVCSVWSAFISLLTAAATRRAVRRAVEQALLAPAAATLAAFNGNSRNGETTADLGSCVSSPSRTRMAAVPPDPASFDCALRFKRDMAAAVRRMAETVLVGASSLSGIRAAARRLSDGASGDSEGGFCSGGGVEEAEGREGGRAAKEEVEDEAVAWVSEFAEECWTFLCSSPSSPLEGLDDGEVSKRLTEILFDKLQGLVGNLGRICSSPSHDEPNILPMALGQPLASSATASLLSHPDVAECVGLGRTEDGEEDDDGGDVAIRPGSRGDHEFGLVVAEMYCSFLSMPESGGGGCCAKIDQQTEKSDATEESDANRAPAREREPSPRSSHVRVRTEDRLHFFRSFTELIHVTAEELMCGMGMNGWHYSDAVNQMTSGLWEIARCGWTPSTVNDAKEGEDEFSIPLPLTKQELHGRSTGVGSDSADNAIPPRGSFPVMVGNDTAAASPPLPPWAGEGNKQRADADHGSTCSSRSTNPPSSRGGSERGTRVMVDSPAGAGPTQEEDAVATPRTFKANACLSCSLI